MKYSTSTYLKDVMKYKLYLYRNKNHMITIKKIIEIQKPFSLIEFGEKIILLNNNYYIVEIMPLNSFYMCRIFLDNHFNVIEEYYTVTKNNQILDGIPVYEDLELSYVKVHGKEKIYHEELLKKNSENYLKEAIEKIKKLNLPIDDLIDKIKEMVM